MQGISFTIGIEMALAGDIIIAADDCRFCQMEAKRGIAPLGGAHFRYVSRSGWGNAMYHLMLCDEFGAEEAYRVGLVQEVVASGTQIERSYGNRPHHFAERASGDTGDKSCRAKVYRSWRVVRGKCN